MGYELQIYNTVVYKEASVFSLPFCHCWWRQQSQGEDKQGMWQGADWLRVGFWWLKAAK